MLSPETPPERVAALVVEEFEGLPVAAGLALRLRRDGSEERVRRWRQRCGGSSPGA